MRNNLILTALLLTLSGCSSVALLPGAEVVVFTKTPEDIRNCKIIGRARILTHENLVPSPRTPTKAATKHAMNTILIQGGDTFLITSSMLGAHHGVIYNCAGVNLRQPVPVQSEQPNVNRKEE